MMKLSAVFRTSLLISLDDVQDHRCQISCDMLDNWGMMKSMQGPCCCELNLNGRKQIFALRGNESKPLNTRLLWICTRFIGLYDATPRMTPMRSALPPGPRAWLWPPLLNITFAWPSNRICLELLFRCVIISTISMIIIWIDFADYNDYIDFMMTTLILQGQRFFIPPQNPLSFPVTGLGPPVLSGSSSSSLSS